MKVGSMSPFFFGGSAFRVSSVSERIRLPLLLLPFDDDA